MHGNIDTYILEIHMYMHTDFHLYIIHIALHTKKQTYSHIYISYTYVLIQRMNIDVFYSSIINESGMWHLKGTSNF